MTRAEPEYGRRSPMQDGERNNNPQDLDLWSLVQEDFRTHGSDLTSPGFWALLVHRLGNRRMDVRMPLRAPLTAAYNTAHYAVIALWGIDMPYCVPIGRRLQICHHGGVHLGAWSVGNDVTIRHCVTIGVASVAEATARSPVIGDGVELGPGATIIGTIEIGDGAFVGPNAVVLEDLPKGATAFGVPARITRND